MSGLASLFLSYIVTCISADDWRIHPDVLDLIGQGIQKELVTVKQPIEEAIVNVGSMNCVHIQKLFGISYEQLQGEREPNLNNLALVYKTRTHTETVNINEAVDFLRTTSKLNGDERLILFIHGFDDDPSQETFNNITQSFLKKGHDSLIAIDASSLTRRYYIRASAYVHFIGYKLGQVLAAAYQQGQDPSLIHIVGNSLGAQISGIIGKTFRVLTGKLIGRISGLDPAGPCFSHVDPDLRLKHTDAEYVDIIHTNAGILGIKSSDGHKDYYPNGGTIQPNCLLQSCSHSRTWLLFGESIINPLAFPALRCKHWDAFKKGECDSEISYMGYPSRPGGRGNYFLQTGGTYPYGLGVSGVGYRNTDGILTSIGNFFG